MLEAGIFQKEPGYMLPSSACYILPQKSLPALLLSLPVTLLLDLSSKHKGHAKFKCFLMDHRIIQARGTSGGLSSLPSCSKLDHLRSDWVAQGFVQLDMKISTNGSCTSFLGSLCCCLAVLMVKKNLLSTLLNFSHFHFRPLSLLSFYCKHLGEG